MYLYHRFIQIYRKIKKSSEFYEKVTFIRVTHICELLLLQARKAKHTPDGIGSLLRTSKEEKDTLQFCV